MGKCHKSQLHTPGCHIIMSHDRSHDEYGKIVYRPYSSCISNVQEIDKDSIKFSLLT